MSSRRVLKAAEAIREVVSMAILTEVRDPRVKNVTVTMVELSADMKTAKVHVSVMGDEKQQKLAFLFDDSAVPDPKLAPPPRPAGTPVGTSVATPAAPPIWS